MPRKKTQPANVGEELRIAVTLALQNFRLQEEQAEIEFPSSLTSTERAFIHKLADSIGLKSKSRGKAANRFLTVYKKHGSTIVQADAVFALARMSRHHVSSLLSKFPVTNRERQELLPPTERDRLLQPDVRDVNRATGRLNSGIPQVPGARGTGDLSRAGQQLPIWPLKDDILRTVGHNQVTLLVGDTGSGKTTQVPQFLLDQYHAAGRPLRILCTQPRRISALTVAERVAAERDETVGQTVGYQIRLESRVSPKTLLTFCTSGVLLRTLMGGDGALATVTHVIVDEIHERDRFADFLMAVLRDSISKYRNLKIILMSATMDTQLFVKYFHVCPVVKIPGKMYEVKEYFLEDVLRETKFTSPEMERAKAELRKRQALSSWTEHAADRPLAGAAAAIERPHIPAPILGQQTEPTPDRTELEPWLVELMDRCISTAWLAASEESFTQLLHLIMTENVSVDYQHSETSATPLMVAAGRGNLNAVEQLLSLGASTSIHASNGWTARDWAQRTQQTEAVELIDAYGPSPAAAQEAVDAQLSEEDRQLLQCYQLSHDDERVDVDLVVALLKHVLTGEQPGSVLVFLPGYDDLVKVREVLSESRWFTEPPGQHALFVLHSNMQSGDQRRVFRPVPAGTRKVVLSTNIAETSVTIQDIVFVIDTGKVKEKSFDSITGVSQLRPTWVSRASALQRRGRAGRCQPGVCYHLFSRSRFQALQPYQTPEILRTPLQELCLHSKMLSPPNTPIADFLAKTPDPPPFMVTRAAVQLLKTIDALDPWEDVTELGHHLLDLPVEPRLGKAVLYSIVLKCLDPVLTIVCCLAHRDPFVLPAIPAQKRAAAAARKKLAANTYSDHMTLLRAFQAWQKARNEGWERSFCEKNFVSSATMETVVGMRTQLLGQLRASGFVRARGAGDIRDLNSNSEIWAVVKAALCAGCYPNLIRVDREQVQLRTQRESRVRLHPSSTLADAPKSARTTAAQAHRSAIESLPADWLMFEELSRSGRVAHVRCCTLVSPITVALMAGPARLPLDAVSEADAVLQGMRGDSYMEADSDSEVEERSEGQKTMLKLDEWVGFRVDTDAAHLALQLRQKWHALFIRRMRAPGKTWSQVDDHVIRTLIAVLTTEEQALGLQQPPGIGQRPRPVISDVFSGGGPREPPPPAAQQQGPPGPQQQQQQQQQQPRVSPDQAAPAREARPKSGDRGGGSSAVSTGSSGAGGGGGGAGSANPSARHSPTPRHTDTGQHGAANNGRYFIIKANSTRAVDASVTKCVWAFTPNTERKLLHNFKEGRTVYLVFSAQGSGHFQGYAKFLGQASSERCPDLQGPNLGQSYKIEWVKRANIPFQATRHLINPYNEHRRVQTSRDGQEVQPQVGSALCRLWDRPENRSGPPGGPGGGTHLPYGLEQPDDPPPGVGAGLGPQPFHQPPPGPQGPPGGGGQAAAAPGPPPPPQGFAGRPIRGKTYPPPPQQGRGFYRGQGFRQ
ncbi:3'-5' RNA helicase YTHDC2-like isoform X2 [Amphibalanus amphitrite]|nr:3'-5' RNA helicase YTHDC2-like isoform X2 [Amphibalanus amphitrite]